MGAEGAEDCGWDMGVDELCDGLARCGCAKALNIGDTLNVVHVAIDAFMVSV